MTIEKKVTFNCQPAQLWEIVGTPDRVDWVPGVTDCVFDGKVRSLNLPGAGSIKEEILARDAEAMTMEYSCTESPIPLESHLANMKISQVGDKTLMLWTTEITPVAFEKFIEESMDGAIQQLHSMLD